ncbi:MAG: XRE family transcriptional regulator [Bacteroidales bacterium]|nr:XRE family transcriptional regulator [Bacteroidales bacterium]
MHIGRQIEKILNEKRYSAVWLAKQINCDRRNIYDIFKRECIDTELLKRISIALQHDFFKDLSEDTF